MDIQELKKFMKKKIESDNISKEVRNLIKINQWEKQDSREGFTESFSPLIESQEKVSEEINKQKEETLNQLKANQEAMNKNQLALTSGIKKLALEYNSLNNASSSSTDDDTKSSSTDDDTKSSSTDDDTKSSSTDDDKKSKSLIDIDLEKDFNDEEIKKLIELNLVRPKNFLFKGEDVIKSLNEETDKIIKRMNGFSVGKQNIKKLNKIFLK